MLKLFIFCALIANAIVQIIAILGGRFVTIDEYKNFNYMAVLQITSENFICGGVIIADNKIITNAHCTSCFALEDITVRVGAINISSGYIVEVERISEYPEYGMKTYANNDVSVIILKNKLILNETINKIRIATLQENYIYDNVGHNVTITGYGKTNEIPSVGALRVIELPIVDWNICNERYNGTYPETLTRNMSCYGNLLEMDTEKGDSGGK